jgi:hypothetical protein
MAATGFAQRHTQTLFQRWRQFYSLPNKPSEYFISVDHHKIWRRHLAWSLRDGDGLRNAVTSRFASNMVFMSLLLGTEIGVLFSPSRPANSFREALDEEKYESVNFWAGIVLCISIGMTLSTLVANFTAWAIIGAVSPQNSHAILRSSIGLYAAQLPARLVVLSIYCFVVWIMLFIFVLLPNPHWSWAIALFPIVLISHIVVVYSSFGRLVMYTKAMRKDHIFGSEEEDSMTPKRLFEELLKRAEIEKKKNAPLPLYYRRKSEIQKQLSQMRNDEHFIDAGFESQNVTSYLNKILEQPDDIVGRTSSASVSVSTPLELPDFGGEDEETPRDSTTFLNTLREGGSTTQHTQVPSLVFRSGVDFTVGLDDSPTGIHPLRIDKPHHGHHHHHRAGPHHRRESSGVALHRSSIPQSPAV